MTSTAAAARAARVQPERKLAHMAHRQGVERPANTPIPIAVAPRSDVQQSPATYPAMAATSPVTSKTNTVPATFATTMAAVGCLGSDLWFRCLTSARLERWRQG